MSLARRALIQLRGHERNPRNWRPHILVFVGDIEKRVGLVRMANAFNHNLGVVTACRLVEADLAEADPGIDRMTDEMNRTITAEGLVAFCEVNVVREFESGVIATAQANGIAGLRSNTVMVGWPNKPGRLEAWLRILRALSRAGISTLIVRFGWDHETSRRANIDLWWGGLQHNGDMMLLLAHLLCQNPEWHGARVRVRAIARSEEERANQEQGLEALLSEVRIDAETDILMKPGDTDIAEVIHRHSAGADLVFLGLQEPVPGTEEAYARRLDHLANGLNTVVFVRNAGEFAGKLV
jgi:hypothetical protein